MKCFNRSTNLRNIGSGVVRTLLRSFTMLTIAVALFACAICQAQIQTTNVSSAIELARADMTSERNAIVSAAMQLNDKDAAAFWPIYRKYEYERSLLDDGRAAVVKEYAEKYSTLTDSDARSMTERMLQYDSREAVLKKKYFRQFSNVLSAITVAKFFQLDHRVDILMDMKVESSFPPLWAPETSDQTNGGQQITESQHLQQNK